MTPDAIATTSVAATNALPIIQLSDLTLGAELGRGGYCDVTSVKSVKRTSADKKPALPPNITTNSRPLAVKRVRSNLQREKYETGIRDLRTEVRILTELSLAGGGGGGSGGGGHPNIISLHAIGVDLDGSNGSDDDNDGDDDGDGTPPQIRFLLLDQLTTTLKSRVEYWQNHQPGMLVSFGKRGHHQQQVQWLERMQVLTQIADAVHFLHYHNVIHRDLNLGNIGFDVDGTTAKLFDFGLARKLDPSKRAPLMLHDNKDDCCVDSNDGNDNHDDDMAIFEMTAKTGTMRFMAPEVAWGEPYGLGADVYSLSIIMHHILALRDPWKYIRPSQFSKDVIKGKYRPDVITSWPVELQRLQKRMWDNDWRERPTSTEVLSNLRTLIKGNPHELYPRSSAIGKLFGSR